MVDTAARSDPQPYSPSSVGRPIGGRQRVISSCLTCRRRKVRCDHMHPICGACTRGSHSCTYAADHGGTLGATLSSGRISKPSVYGNGKLSKGGDVQARLDRLELLLERAAVGQSVKPPPSVHYEEEHKKHGPETQVSPSSTSQTSQGQGISSDCDNGTLLLDRGQSQFVSSLHYALLADEIQDIKALLSDKTDEGADEPTQNSLIHLLSLGRAKIGITLESLLPESKEQRAALLDIYFSNVDPMVRITHKPSLLRKFPTYMNDTHPLGFAVLHAAVNSLPSSIVENRFGEKKDELLARFELGVEIGLARDNYLTSQSLDVFQGFILWLTCITSEEDTGKAWTLLGIAIRIALNQGLHRDPSLFPSRTWDAVTIELRRRTWHQICHLEFKAAEFKGQEPSISEEDYTTMLPRNIEDEELIEGASPGPNAYNEERFTTNTFQLVRFIGMRTLRRIVKSTYRLERRMLESGLHGTSGPDIAQELRSMFEQIKAMVSDMHEEYHRKYLRFCSPDKANQRLALGLASLLEWRCYLLFWLRMPRAYRDVVFPTEIRKSIFEKSVNSVETLNGATVDVEAARFQWHIGSHSAFQAIMHILSELQNPLFDSPDRPRALRALRLSRLLKENNNTKPWAAIRNMIDRVVGENTDDSRSSQSQESVLLNGPPALPVIPTTVRTNVNLQDFTKPLSPYMSQSASLPGAQPIVSSLAHPQPLQLAQNSEEEQLPFNWDELTFNNTIAGDMQTSAEMPEFDFGFWGDPVNFGNEPLTFPLDNGGYFTPWSD